MARTPGKFYIGNPGYLLELPVPDRSFTYTDVRAGSSKATLWGNQAVHTTGFSRVYEMTWTGLDRTEFDLLNKIYHRAFKGPYLLFDPQVKNQLPFEHSLTTRTDKSYGLTADPGKTEILNSPNYGANFGFTTFWKWDPLGYASEATTHGDYLKDWIFPGEQYTYSFWFYQMSSQPQIDATVKLLYFGPGNSYVGQTTPKTVTSYNTWTRISETFTAPTDAVRVQPYWNSPATTPDTSTHQFFIGSPQLEFGSVATDFEAGTGVPKVAISEMSVESPRLGLYNVSATIVEV
jgi:hypothetical protein